MTQLIIFCAVLYNRSLIKWRFITSYCLLADLPSPSTFLYDENNLLKVVASMWKLRQHLSRHQTLSNTKQGDHPYAGRSRGARRLLRQGLLHCRFKY
jgi:hypothetical protein